MRLGARGGTWSRDGTILFGAFGQRSRVADTGGVPTPATALDPSRQHQARLARVPARWAPLSVPGAEQDPAQTAIYQGTLDSNETRRVVRRRVTCRVSPAAHLLSLSKGLLIARPYDADRAQVGDALDDHRGAHRL